MIQLSEKLGIDADSRSFKLMKPVKKKRGMVWEPYKYYSTLDTALEEIVRDGVRQGVHLGSFEHVYAEIDKRVRMIEQNMTVNARERLAVRRSEADA